VDEPIRGRARIRLLVTVERLIDAAGAFAGASAVALAALALLIAGCGGSDPDEPVRAYLEAIVEQDGEAACDQLSDELRADIERAPAARATGRTCPDVMELAAGLNPDLSTEDVEDLEIEVEEEGDEATATLENPLAGREETIDLVEADGEWRISTLEIRPTD
jgi:hypothetical protein